MRRRVLSVLVRDRLLVLARISSLIGRKGYNINSLVVAPSGKPGFSRMTIALEADDAGLEQVRKQLEKLYDVIAALALNPDASVTLEIVLAKIEASKDERDRVYRIAQDCGARAVDVDDTSLTLALTDESQRIDSFLQFLSPFTLLELARSGVSALGRGSGTVISC